MAGSVLTITGDTSEFCIGLPKGDTGDNSMKTTAIKPLGISFSAINEIAEKSATLLGYAPGADLVPLIEKINGRIAHLAPREATELSRITVHTDGSFVIELSSFLLPLQERLAIAHELGHYVLHSKAGKVPLTAQLSPYADDDDAESEAQEFASAFLMPSGMLRDAIASGVGNDLLSLSAYFMVPVQIVAERLKAIDI